MLLQRPPHCPKTPTQHRCLPRNWRHDAAAADRQRHHRGDLAPRLSSLQPPHRYKLKSPGPAAPSPVPHPARSGPHFWRLQQQQRHDPGWAHARMPHWRLAPDVPPHAHAPRRGSRGDDASGPRTQPWQAARHPGPGPGPQPARGTLSQAGRTATTGGGCGAEGGGHTTVGSSRAGVTTLTSNVHRHRFTRDTGCPWAQWAVPRVHWVH